MKTHFRWEKRLLCGLLILLLLAPATCSYASSAGDSQSSASETKVGTLEPYPEPVTIRVGRDYAADFTWVGEDTLEDNQWTRAYKDWLNIELDNMWVVDPSQRVTKMNSAIAAGDYPDIFTIQPQDYAKYAASGVIADVTDLYDEYMTENGWRAVNADDGYSLDAMRINGRLYGIPIVDNPLDMLNVLFIRRDWLEKLDLEVPQTVEDFWKVCEAFVTQDPDGNGKDDTYALVLDGKNISGDWGALEAVFEMYGAYPLGAGYATNFSLIEDGAGGLKWGGENESVKDALTMLQEAYRNRWIAQDFGTHDPAKGIAEFGAGKAGMFFAPMWGGWSAAEPMFTNFPEADIVTTPLPGQDGYGKAFYVSSLNSMVVVSTKCKNPEALFKLFCLGKELVAYQEDQDIFNRYNGDGINYTGSKAGIIDPLMPMKNLENFYKVSEAVKTGDTSNLNAEQMHDFALIKENYLDVTEPPTLENVSEYTIGYGLWHVFGNPEGGYAAIVKALEANAFMYAGYGTAATEPMSAVSSTLTDLITTSMIKIIYGEEDVAYWDTVIQNWHALGGDTVLSEANAWYQSK